MRKKLKSKKVLKKRSKLPKFWIFSIISTVFVLGLVSVLTIFNNSSAPLCANSISCINDLSGKFDESAKEGVFLGQKISVPKTIVKDDTASPVLGQTTGEKRIEIDLSSQRLFAYQGDQLVYTFLVSTGKWGRTPTGTFNIWVKLRATRMTGGNPAIGTYYNLPNVQYTMYFYNAEIPKSRGYGLHGAYWHNNFGHPMSHGCINMRTEEAKLIYDWADPPTNGYTTNATIDNPGTKIVIYGQAPNE